MQVTVALILTITTCLTLAKASIRTPLEAFRPSGEFYVKRPDKIPVSPHRKMTVARGGLKVLYQTGVSLLSFWIFDPAVFFIRPVVRKPRVRCYAQPPPLCMSVSKNRILHVFNTYFKFKLCSYLPIAQHRKQKSLLNLNKHDK